MSLRDKFLKRAATREITEHDIGLDEPVFLRPLRKSQKSKIESIASKEHKTAKDCTDIRFIVLRDCLCDSDGVEILSAADRESFESWDESFVEPIFEAALRSSSMSVSEIEDGEEKN